MDERERKIEPRGGRERGASGDAARASFRSAPVRSPLDRCRESPLDCCGEDAPDLSCQNVRTDRLRQEGIPGSAIALAGVGSVSRDDHDRNVLGSSVVPDATDRVHSIHVRKLQVHDDEVGLEGERLREAGSAIVGFGDLEVSQPEIRGVHLPIVRAVFDEEEQGPGARDAVCAGVDGVGPHRASSVERSDAPVKSFLGGGTKAAWGSTADCRLSPRCHARRSRATNEISRHEALRSTDASTLRMRTASWIIGPVECEFLSGGGQMGALMRAFDWSRNPLGPVERWPHSLRTSINIILNARQPMLVLWGPELIHLYNDSYARILGPDASKEILGRACRDVWSRCWDTIGPVIQVVMEHGEPVSADHLALSLMRNGYLEEAYFAFSCSGIHDDRGTVGGVFVTCSETTERILSERRLRTLRDLAQRTMHARTTEQVSEISMQTLSSDSADIPLALLYLGKPGGRREARLAGALGIDQDTAAAPLVIDLEKPAEKQGTWPIAEVVRTGQPRLITDLSSRFGTLHPKGWPEPVRAAMILPLAGSGKVRAHGALVMGLSPRRPIDDEYRGFFDLVAMQVSAALSNAHAHELERQRIDALSEMSRVRKELVRREQVARAEAEESRRFLFTLISNLPGMAYRGCADAERTIEFASDGITDLTGYALSKFLGGKVSYGELVHAEDRDRMAHEIEQAVRDRRPFKMVYRLVNSMGEERWVREQGRGIYGADAALVALEGFVTDITELKWTEAQLREESHTVRMIHQVGSYLAAELDLEKVVQSVTDAATELSGAAFGAFFQYVGGQDGKLERHGAPNERPERVPAGVPSRDGAASEPYKLFTVSGLPRQAFGEFPIPRNTDVFVKMLKGARVLRFDDVTRAASIEARGARSTSSPGAGNVPERPPLVRSYLAVAVVSRSGEVLGALILAHPEPSVFAEREEQLVVGLASQAAIAIDNARLLKSAQEARAEAEAANRAKDEFLATLSHEIRTPLNAMMGWSQLLAKESLEEEVFARAVQSIARNTKVLSQLIQDLLDVSRIVTGKLRLEMRPVNLEPVILAAIDTVRPAAENKGVRIRTSIHSPIDLVSGDPARLQQVVWNLMSNAIKFTPSGGRVDVRLEQYGLSLKIIVSDTGKGVSSEFLPHIFERFRQADSSSTRAHGGLGLGLAIVRHIVELHGGVISAESAGEGRGATFIVELPFLAEDVGPAVAEPRSTDEVRVDEIPNLAGVRVLVVDDEADARELLTTLLERFGANVRAVSSARDALNAIQIDRPDVLVSDIGMPSQDGYSLIRCVRALSGERGGSVPAVALTAYATGQDRDRALAAGFQGHISKPIEAAELVRAVACLAGPSARAFT